MYICTHGSTHGSTHAHATLICIYICTHGFDFFLGLGFWFFRFLDLVLGAKPCARFKHLGFWFGAALFKNLNWEGV